MGQRFAAADFIESGQVGVAANCRRPRFDQKDDLRKPSSFNAPTETSFHMPRCYRFCLLCTGVCLASSVLLVAFSFGQETEPRVARLPAEKTEASASAASEETQAELIFDHPAATTPGKIIGQDGRLQLVVSHRDQQGTTSDATREVVYSTDPPGLLAIDQNGMATPLGNGQVTITASNPHGNATQTTVVISDYDEDRPVSFPSQVVPIFTKQGCNGGGCHGKASGQNGFRLSLLGFVPLEDHARLVSESRGRRIFPAAPDRSLLLTKATAAVPHGGGKRLDRDSHEYRLLRRWIAQGAPYSDGDEPELLEIEVLPAERTLKPVATQQLAVVARYSDGTTEDITRAAQYESNDSEMAEASPTGLVALRDLPGDVAVMARYQGQVAVFRALIPWQGETDLVDASQWPTPVNAIDTAVFDKFQRLRIPLSPPCDDATYLRRVTLDLAGRLPTATEIEQYEATPTEVRRDELVERLLASRDYAEYFAKKWNAILRNGRDDEEDQFGAWAFHEWIRDSFAQNMPYDEFVREIVTASGTVASNPPVVWYRQVPDAAQRVEDAAQLFLGQQIRCARCHHHPYEKWSQRDYGKMSAFFTSVVEKGDDATDRAFTSQFGTPTAAHPATGERLQPAGLDGPDLAVPETDDPRDHLVDWMVAPENPFFARSVVNRYWKHFLGRGLVEPEDDLRVTNPPSNPALLDALAAMFVESGYDLKGLCRQICRSHVYQLDSEPVAHNVLDRRSFSRFYPKRLTAEVLLDAVDRVTQAPSQFAGVPPGTRAVALPDSSFPSYFLAVFGRPEAKTACECERLQDANLAQSLHLLNSEEMQKKLSADGGRAATLAAEEGGSDEAKITQLYLAAFCRPPRSAELEKVLGYLARQPDRRAAYEDVVWSLVNSKEFLFNH